MNKCFSFTESVSTLSHLEYTIHLKVLQRLIVIILVGIIYSNMIELIKIWIGLPLINRIKYTFIKSFTLEYNKIFFYNTITLINTKIIIY